jgi:hypothetical protein
MQRKVAQYIEQHWKLTTTKVLSNFPNGETVPQRKLRDDSFGVTVTCLPYMDIFEPCIPFYNGCELIVSFDQGFPTDLLQSLNSTFYKNRPLKLEQTDRQVTMNFFIEKDSDHTEKFGLIVTHLQQYFILKMNCRLYEQPPMIKGFDALRDFVNLPKRPNFFPLRSQQFFKGNVRDQIEYTLPINAEEMANSPFGQASHTAKKLGRRR